MAGDYPRALDLTDQVLKQTPDVAVVHEFRGLCLFALKRYDEAAAVQYAVLTAGPGWNWTTLVGLYPDVDTYTNQLRALEAYGGAATPIRHRLNSCWRISTWFKETRRRGRAQFQRVSALVPGDQLSASFAKLYNKAKEQPAAVAAAAPAGQPAAQPGAAPAQPAAAGGHPAAASTVAANAPPAGERARPECARERAISAAAPSASAARGDRRKLEDPGRARRDDRPEPEGRRPVHMGSRQQGPEANSERPGRVRQWHPCAASTDGPPLVGKVTQSADNQFLFAPAGAGDKNPGLTFTKSAA